MLENNIEWVYEFWNVECAVKGHCLAFTNNHKGQNNYVSLRNMKILCRKIKIIVRKSLCTIQLYRNENTHEEETIVMEGDYRIDGIHMESSFPNRVTVFCDQINSDRSDGKRYVRVIIPSGNTEGPFIVQYKNNVVRNLAYYLRAKRLL